MIWAIAPMRVRSSTPYAARMHFGRDGSDRVDSTSPRGAAATRASTLTATPPLPSADAVNDEFTLGRRPALDGLRALSVLAVVLVHANVPYGEGGFLGVDVFFALSGFLITTLLLEEVRDSRRISLKAFYARRNRRLMPAFLLFIAVGFLVTAPGVHATQRHQLITGSITSLLYVRNWFQIATNTTRDGYAHAHLWSLAVEEQFYFVWPIAMVGLTRLRRSNVARIVGLLIAASVLVSVVLANGEPGRPRIYLATDTRAAQLLAGALLAILLKDSARLRTWFTRFAPIGLPLSVLAVGATMLSVRILGGARFFRAYDRGGMAAFGLLVALVVGFLMFAPTSPVTRLLSSRPLVAVGRYSYAIYLWHVLVINLFSPNNVFGFTLIGIDRVAIRTPVVILVSTAVAAASMRFVEAPLQRRLFPWANHPKRGLPG